MLSILFSSFAEMLTALKPMLRDNDISVRDIDYTRNAIIINKAETSAGALARVMERFAL